MCNDQDVHVCQQNIDISLGYRKAVCPCRQPNLPILQWQVRVTLFAAKEPAKDRMDRPLQTHAQEGNFRGDRQEEITKDSQGSACHRRCLTRRYQEETETGSTSCCTNRVIEAAQGQEGCQRRRKEGCQGQCWRKGTTVQGLEAGECTKTY